MKLPVMPADKANHAVYGAVLASLGMLWNPLFAFGLVMVFGLGKEVVDLVRKTGNPEGEDAAATIFGGLVVLFPYLMGI